MEKLLHYNTAQEIISRQAEVIQGMMADLKRTILILNIDISTEVGRVGILDRSDPAYPILARTLGARRDNLKITIAALEQRLRTIKAATDQAIASAA